MTRRETARFEVAAFMVNKSRSGWRTQREDVVVSRADGIGNVTVTITDMAAPQASCDVKINNSSSRTANNEPRNCVYIESNFGFESEPKVVSLSLPVSYQKEYFTSGSTPVRHSDRAVRRLEGYRETAYRVL